MLHLRSAGPVNSLISESFFNIRDRQPGGRPEAGRQRLGQARRLSRRVLLTLQNRRDAFPGGFCLLRLTSPAGAIFEFMGRKFKDQG
ncbi:MAG: hypothetical protein WD491_02270 [Balneolales bacterium]